MPQNFTNPDARRRIFYLSLAAALVALDRLTKAAVASALPLHDARVMIEGFFNLVHTRNTGIAFSLFADAGPLVKDVVIPLFSAAAVGLILYLFLKSGPLTRRTRIGLTLILAGAVGNLYDRFVYGYVVDFLDFYVGRYHWPAFNVADSCITVGAGLLLLDAAFGSVREPRREAESA